MRAERRLRIGCAGQYLAALVVGVALCATWLLSGVPAGEALRFIAFEAFYTLLPGCLLYVSLSPEPGGWLRTLAIGWPCGYALEVGWFALTAALGARGAYALLPLLALLTMGPLVVRRLRKGTGAQRGASSVSGGTSAARTNGSAGWEEDSGVGDGAAARGHEREALVVAGAISAAILLLAFAFYTHAPLPAHARSVFYAVDNVFDISLAAEARHHWPMTEPWVAGQPFHYYTGAFMHVAAANQLAGVAMSTTILRLFPATMLLLTALQLWFLGSSIGGSVGRARWTGPLAAVLMLALADLNLDPIHTELFHINPFSQFWASPTFAFGVPFFLALLAVVQSRLLSDDVPGSKRALVLVALLILGCGAAKTFAAAVFIGGLGLFWLVSAIAGRPARLLLLCLIVSIVSIGAVYFVMLAGGMSGYLGLHPFDFLNTGSSFVSMKNALRSFSGQSWLWIPTLAIGGPLLAVVLLAPLLGAMWLLRRDEPLSPSVNLLLCMFFVGVLAYVTLGAPDGVEGVFLIYGYIALLPVAALGLVNLWSDTPIEARRPLLGACAIVLAVGLTLAGLTQTLPLAGHSRKLWYLLVYGLLALVLALAVLRLARLFSPTVPTRLARIVACCIPLLTVLGLVKPMTLDGVGAWKTVHHEQQAVPDSASSYGMTAALYRGLLWTRAHTSSCDVLAVNNHYESAPPAKSLYFYYSAFTERRVFLESWKYTANGLEAQPFPARYKLNTQALAQGDPAALAQLRNDGVSYVLIDKIHGGGAAEPASVSRLVFSNSALDVYRLLPAGRTRGCSTVS